MQMEAKGGKGRAREDKGGQREAKGGGFEGSWHENSSFWDFDFRLIEVGDQFVRSAFEDRSGGRSEPS